MQNLTVLDRMHFHEYLVTVASQATWCSSLWHPRQLGVPPCDIPGNLLFLLCESLRVNKIIFLTLWAELTETCNLACTYLLMNPDDTSKPGQSDLLYSTQLNLLPTKVDVNWIGISSQLSFTAHGLLVVLAVKYLLLMHTKLSEWVSECVGFNVPLDT